MVLAYISFNVTDLNVVRFSVYIYKSGYNLLQFIGCVLILSSFVKYK
jgi:hypothetical protein